jgi:hypothetical protein
LPSFKGKPRPLEINARIFPFVAILFSFLKSELRLVTDGTRKRAPPRLM